MSFMVVTLTQENCREFINTIYEKEEEAIVHLLKLLEEEYYEIKEENPSVFPLLIGYVKENKRFFNWLWENRGHGFFAWIVKRNEETKEFVFNANDEFLRSFQCLREVFCDEIQKDEVRRRESYLPTKN